MLVDSGKVVVTVVLETLISPLGKMRQVEILLGFGLLAVVSVAGRSVIPTGKDKADVDTLQLVQIVRFRRFYMNETKYLYFNFLFLQMWRHGDRTPIVQYPNDPLKNETLWHPYATGFEAITKVN